MTPRLNGLDPRSLTALAGARPERPDVPGWKMLAPLGEGGLGVVWRATRESDGMEAAIKVPRADDVSLVERLEVEARILQSLDHPNIVRLLESGPLEGGSLYLALELVDGPPLSQCVPVTGYPSAEAYGLFRQIAEAVAYAHSRHVLHRDLKPANVLLDAAGHARVADFGLAQSVAGRVQRLSLTLTGLVAGTAEYLPPEAYRSDYQADAATDIYALGVILHELLTGHPPRGAWRDVSREKKDVDIRIDDVLRRALDPDPAQRFPTVSALVAEFDRIRSSPARFSGTPRLTRAVRLFDFVWSAIGLFLLLGSFGVLARIEKFGFRLPIDLVGTDTIRIGSYQAIVILLSVAAPACVWQLFRLWRFRSVPLREALPSPFGVRLGSSRIAAVAVATAQLAFVIAPVFFGVQIWREKCMRWLTADDFPWAQGFVLTEGIHGTKPLDPWAWPEKGKTYSLRDRVGGANQPLGYNIDHTNYWPGTIPRLIASLATLYGLTLAATLGRAAIDYCRYRRWSHAAVLSAGTFFSGAVVRAEFRAWARDVIVEEHSISLAKRHFDRSCQKLGEIVASIASGTDPLARFGGDFGETVTVLGKPTSDQESLGRALNDLAADLNRPGRHLDFRVWLGNPGESLDTFNVCHVYADCVDEPNGTASGALTLLALRGRLIYNAFGQSPKIVIGEVLLNSIPLWRADCRVLSPQEAEAWIAKFTAALAEPGSPDSNDPFARLFLPQMLERSSDVRWEPELSPAPFDRATLAAALRPKKTPDHPPQIGRPQVEPLPFPGGRQRVTFTLSDGGEPAVWKADLVFQDGDWRCAQLLTR